MAIKTDKKDTRRAGFYWNGTEPYLSVTETLKVLAKPALQYWYGKMVYYAMVKDPTMNEQDALASPYNASKTAANRGSTIHSLIEAYKATGDRLEFVPEPLQGYAEAFYQFMKDVKPTVIAQEKTVMSEEHKIAGTLDMYCTINGTKTILDVKTGKGIYSEVELQLSAYAHMMRESGNEVDQIAVLLLETGDDDKPTGKYIYKTLTERWDIFMATYALYCWSNQDKLVKVGYRKEVKE